MSTRERRVSRPPLKYAAQDEYWEQGRRKDTRPVRQVYRLLKQKDVRKDLAGQEVHVYWPEDQQWYRAAVEEVSVQQPEPSAYLHYPDTDEYEEVDLYALIEAKQVAVIENRSYYAKLKRDEIPVSVADRISAVYEDDDDGSDDAGANQGDSDDDDDDDEPRMSREHHKQVQRSKRPREMAMEREGNAKRTAGAHSGGHEGPARHHPVHHPLGNGAASDSAGGTAAAAAATATADPLAGGDNDMAEAEAFKNSIINALMHTFTGPGAGPSTMIPTPAGGMIPTPGGGGAEHTPMVMIPTPGSAGGEHPGSGRGPSSGRGERPSSLRHQNSLPSASSVGSDDEVRSKVREQLLSALQRAVEELKAEGCTEILPDPLAVASDVEAELYKLHENSVSKDYKAKFRSLSFNLRDSANPGLRARVLRGELPPPQLVTLGAAELARKELSEWRQKRQEEAAKMVFLDAETAAKFSTAAAAALAQSRISSKEEEAAGAKPTTSPQRAAPPAEGAPSEGHAAAAAAEDAEAAVMSAAAASALADSAQRRPLGSLTRVESGGAGGAGASGGDDAVGGLAAAPDLIRRTSLQGSATGMESAAAAQSSSAATPTAATTTAAGVNVPSPAKRTVLRAALPAAPVAGDETPPRTEQDGDAPYDPGSYDEPYDPEQQQQLHEDPQRHHDDDDLPTYNPFGTPAVATKTTGAPSVASLRGGPSGGAGRQSSLPSPIRSPPAVVADLAPCIQRQQPGEGPLPDLPPDNVGDTMWTGVLRVPSQPADQMVVVEVSYLGGSGRLGPMLRCAEPATELLVKGQVKVSRVEQFFEELRRSRSRTITLALVRQLSHEAAAAVGLGEAAEAAARCGGLEEFAAQHRTRTGLATPQGALEAYLVARGPLAARLLTTARVVCPSHQLPLLPEDIGEDQLLLALVHPRTWEPPPHLAHLPQQPQPHHDHQGQYQGLQHPHSHQQQPQHLPHSGPAPIDLDGLPPAAAAGMLPSPGGMGLPVTDPRLRGAPAEPSPLMHPPPGAAAGPGPAAPPPADASGGGGGDLPIDLGALSDLAAALGIPGGGGAGAPAVPPGPAPTAFAAGPPPAPEPSAGPQVPDPNHSTQLVTMVMQNPDGTLAIVAVPQGAPPPGPGQAPHGAVLLQPPQGPFGPPQGGLGMGPPPAMAEHHPHFQHPPPHHHHQQPPPHGHPEHAGGPHPQYLIPSGPPGPGPYGEPPPPEHYPGARYSGPPPGSRGGQGPPPGGAGGPPAPYLDLRSGGPPPPHHGYPPQQQQPDPYYGGGPQPPHHYHPPPGHGHGGEPAGPPPYGPPRDGPEGRPPPYYPPRDGPDGGGYDDPYYHRGGAAGPHDPYRGGPPPGRGGRGAPPQEREWGEHGSGGGGGRWGGGRRGRGRGGPPDEGRGGYGYEAYGGDRGGGGRPHDGGGRGGRGGREREWGGGRDRREWEGRDRDRPREREHHERGGYMRPEGHHPR